MFARLFLFTAAALALAIGVAYVVARELWRLYRDGRRLLALSIVAVLLGGLGWLVYRALYPGPDFYAGVYEEVTGARPPAGAALGCRTASYPDQQGDYGALAVYRLSGEDEAALRARLTAAGFVDTRGTITDEAVRGAPDCLRLDGVSDFLEREDFAHQCYVSVGFYGDGRVLVHRTSW